MDKGKRRRNGFQAKRGAGGPGLRTKRRVKENKVLEPVRNKEIEDDDEEILSEEVEGIEGDREEFDGEDQEERKENQDEGDDDVDEETADQKRIRMAKEMIERAKVYKKEKEQEEEDDFFLNEGVQRADNEDAVTRALQLDHKKKAQGVFTPIADNVKKSLDAKKYNVEVHTLKGHTKCATAIELDSSGKFLYSVSKDGSLIKWDLAQEKKAILSLGASDKTDRPVTKELLCASLSFDDRYLVTGGSDKMVRLWDARDLTLIESFKGHRDAVYGVKFKSFSLEFVSTGADRVLKLWDAGERAFLDTFYGHKSHVNSVDTIGEHFVTCGFDRQAIYWKTEEGSQLLFKGGSYSLDIIKSINPKHFVTGSQDGTVALWATNKNKPIYDITESHHNCWVTALGSLYNTDLVVSGSYNDALNFYKFNGDDRNIEKIFELPSAGIVNDIKISPKADMVFTCEGDEQRLGRWITKKAKNLIKVYKLK